MKRLQKGEGSNASRQKRDQDKTRTRLPAPVCTDPGEASVEVKWVVPSTLDRGWTQRWGTLGKLERHCNAALGLRYRASSLATEGGNPRVPRRTEATRAQCGNLCNFGYRCYVTRPGKFTCESRWSMLFTVPSFHLDIRSLFLSLAVRLCSIHSLCGSTISLLPYR
jgi:hypothetical protein